MLSFQKIVFRQTACLLLYSVCLSVAAVAQAPTREIVAIYPFSVDRQLGYDVAGSVGNAVEIGFVKSTRFTVVERSRFGSVKDEEKFKEANTTDVIKRGAKFGAKYIVIGHITGITQSSSTSPSGTTTTTYVTYSLKIIDVASGEIVVSEALRAAGGSTASAILEIDGQTRTFISKYFPQRFAFMAVGNKDAKKGYLKTFKIWGGSVHGLKTGDMVEIYRISFVTHPTTKRKLESKERVGLATIIEVNGTDISTLEIYKASKYGITLEQLFTSTPDLVAIEHSGNSRPQGAFDRWLSGGN